jgi:hypothetical protein
LVPYSPDLSIIENVWSFVKDRIAKKNWKKSKARTNFGR